jgi:hypothetical protein
MPAQRTVTISSEKDAAGQSFCMDMTAKLGDFEA